MLNDRMNIQTSLSADYLSLQTTSKEGMDQNLLNKITWFKNWLVEVKGKTNNKEELYAIKMIQRVMSATSAHLQKIQLQMSQLKALDGYVVQIFSIVTQSKNNQISIQLEKVRNLLSNLMKAMNDNIILAEHPLKDPIMDGVVLVKKAEFGDDYEQIQCSLVYKNGATYLHAEKHLTEPEFNLESSIFPSSAKTPEEYIQKIKKRYIGCIEKLSKEKVKNLLSDIYINYPSNTRVLPSYNFIPEQVLIDLPRLSKLKINDFLVYDKKTKWSNAIDKEEIYRTCLQVLNEDINVNIDITKLITQASLARPCIRVYFGFQYPALQLHVSAALDTGVEIRSRERNKPLDSIEVRLWAFFNIKSIDNPHPSMFVGVMRKIICNREFLLNPEGISNRCNAYIEDVYSPLYPKLENAMQCDFDQLAKELEGVGLVIEETKKDTKRFYEAKPLPGDFSRDEITSKSYRTCSIV